MSEDLRKENRFDALKKKYEADIAIAKSELEVYFESSVGVAEHPDTMATIEEELGKISEYKDKLAALNAIGYDYHEEELYKDRWQKSEW